MNLIDIPAYAQDNNAIITGYRGTCLQNKQALLSIFSLHNETGNIW